MLKLLSVLYLFFFFCLPRGQAQSDQTVVNGATTAAVNFAGAGCSYHWANDNPAIGLPASGTGSIPAFTAVNTGSGPVKATITATPVAVGYAYITNAGANTVSVFNTATQALVATIPVGQQPEWASVSPDGSRVYVANHAEFGTVSVIDAASNRVIATVTVGAYPISIALTADGSRAFVSNSNFLSSYGSMSVIDTKTNQVIRTINFNNNTADIAVSKDGSRVFICQGNWVSVIDPITGKDLQDIFIGRFVTALVISPDGLHLYVTGTDYNNNPQATVINAATYAIEAVIPVDNDPYGVAISPDGSQVYVTNWGYGNISVISTASNTVIATIPDAANNPIGVCFSPDGSQAYVVNYSSSDALVINTASHSIVARISLGATSYPNCSGIFVTPVNCNSSPVSFTITVDAVVPVLAATAVSGSISACQGNASTAPAVQQFTVSGSQLSADLTITAPANFEVSLSAGGSYGSQLRISQSGGAVAGTVVYVRSSAVAPMGTLSGNVTVATPGAVSQMVAVAGTVTALPTVTNPANQAVKSGTQTLPVSFTGTGTVFTWTNDTPGIGLALSGTGNIPAFTAVNTGSSAVTANITVTPISKRADFEYLTNATAAQVSVISNATKTIVATIAVGKQPYGLALSPDGSLAYVTNSLDASVSVISTAVNQVVATIPVNSGPIGVAVSPDGSRVYVSCDNCIDVIDASTKKVLSAVLVGNYQPSGLTVSPDGQWLYIADPNNLSLVIINTTTFLQTRLNFPSNADNAYDVVTSQDGTRIYVTGSGGMVVFVVSAATRKVIQTISLTDAGMCIAISPDGSRLYVTNKYVDRVSVVDAMAGILITTITVGTSPEGISVSPDGQTLYVANVGTGTMSVIDAATNQVTATLAAGPTPHALGNFVQSTGGCSGVPVTFQVTVNPVIPVITATVPTGSISACKGTASASPAILQFTASGSDLMADVTATAPPGFEISLAAGSGYGSILIIHPVSGKVNNTVVYVRSAASAAAGSLSGSFVLNSTGAVDQQIAVSGTVYGLPVVNLVADQSVANGAATTTVQFTGTAASYQWTNDKPGIGLAASGTGDIPAFTAVNNGIQPVVAHISVLPVTAGPGCNGTPVTFTVSIAPSPPSITTTAVKLDPLNTVYGTPSASDQLTVSGMHLASGILVVPPTGFEVSTDGVNFYSTVTIGSPGMLTSVPVMVRLAASTGAGGYAGAIRLTQGTLTVTLSMPVSTVTPAPLTVTADNQTRLYGAINPPLTVSYSGFVNQDGPGRLTAQPVVTTTATPLSPIGRYPVSATGAASADYLFQYIPGVLTIAPSISLLVIPNAFTPNGDGINDIWEIGQLDDYPKSVVTVFNRWGQQLYMSIGYVRPWDGTYNGAVLPTGTYYYRIDLHNGQPVIAGWVAIIR